MAYCAQQRVAQALHHICQARTEGMCTVSCHTRIQESLNNMLFPWLPAGIAHPCACTEVAYNMAKVHGNRDVLDTLRTQV